MPISPTCASCGDELEEFGGIYLTPPVGRGLFDSTTDAVDKLHICAVCNILLLAWLKERQFINELADEAWGDVLTQAQEIEELASPRPLVPIKLRAKIGSTDFDRKVDILSDLISQGYDVEVIVMMRGRETMHPELAFKLLERIQEETNTNIAISVEPHKKDDRNYSATFTFKDNGAKVAAVVV